MIDISHLAAMQFRSVLRRSVVEALPRREWPVMICRTDAQGLHLYVQRGPVGVAYDVPGERPVALLSFGSADLAQFEGRTAELVTLESIDPARGRARWYEGRMPRGVEFDLASSEVTPLAPAGPTRWTKMPGSFLPALAAAAETTAKEMIRFALNNVQLRGNSGEMISTDGRQLLIQSGFEFPWKDDVLVPRVRAFGMREIPAEDSVAVGRAEQRIFIRSGRWTFSLDAQTGRFPDVHSILPRIDATQSGLRLHPEDTAYLIEALPNLPGHEDDNAPVTLDLGAPPCLRARAEGSEATIEIELRRSTTKGKPMRVAVNRDFLLRALRLGCVEVTIVHPDQPLHFQGSDRVYIAVPLHQQRVIPPCEGSTRFSTAEKEIEKVQAPTPRRISMPASHANGNSANGNGHGDVDRGERPPVFQELVAEADQVRAQVQEVLGRLTRLITGLKQFRRQSRAVQVAVQSLRDLRLEG